MRLSIGAKAPIMQVEAMAKRNVGSMKCIVGMGIDEAF
jgi:hypothetical protein